MSQHTATINWQPDGSDFTYESYTRNHTWTFDNHATIHATAAPDYKGDPANIDPEEAFVASVASCHMLTFLAIACKKKFSVTSYTDAAVGHLEKTESGKLAITRVELSPRIQFSGDAPDDETIAKMHHTAHAHCFIANSINCAVEIR